MEGIVESINFIIYRTFILPINLHGSLICTLILKTEIKHRKPG